MIPPEVDNPDQAAQLDSGLAAAFGPVIPVADDWEGLSVLAALESRLGTGTRVHLREEDRSDNGLTPIRTPGTDTRYQLLAEIAAGGMGVIIRSRDNDLGRDVAMKVLHPRHAGNRAMVRRFLEEAQIAGQLQHPGILQVYELGLRPDKRPYFTMKLIKGRTLAELLAARESPDEDRRRFIGIFERICQTMAYAHSRGVIHRDLKPANIMAGNFGEVQIVDWGLAKIIGRPDARPKDEPGAEPEGADTLVPAETEIIIPDSDQLGPASVAGSIMGTPAYMPPEQARGDVDQIDERCDVFALGAILCEMLTGKPPYPGNGTDALEDAKVGHLDEAWERIDASGADEELVAVARACLGRRRRDRPADGRDVAARVSQYLASADDRARRSELEAVEARARVVEERRRRHLAVALAASILFAVLLGGGGIVWSQNDRLKRIAADSQKVNDELTAAMALLAEAKETPVGGQEWPWMALRAAGAQVAALHGKIELDEETRDRASAFLDEFHVADRDRRVIEQIEDLVIVGATHEDAQSWRRMEQELRKAFLDYGIDLLGVPRDEIAARIRQSEFAPQLADGLELWIGTLGYLSELAATSYTPDELLAWVTTLYEADPDPYRTRIREQVYAADPDAAELRSLALSEDFETAMPRTLAWLGSALMRVQAFDAMDDVYRRALLLHPTDFMLNFDYAYTLESLDRREAAIRYYHRALTLRPKNAGMWRRLGNALRASEDQDLDGAINALEQSIKYQPDYAPTHVDMGLTRIARGELAEAIAAYRTAMNLEPDLAVAHCHLGRALQSGGFLSEALIELQRGHELGSAMPRWQLPSEEWIIECRRLLDDRRERPATPWRAPG